MGRSHAQILPRVVLVFFPVVACLVWSSWPAAKALVAATSLMYSSDDKKSEPATNLVTRRQIQKHFLNFDVYVPTTDILLAAELSGTTDSLDFQMRKICGSGKIHIWLPLRFRFPIMGEKILEWCVSQ